jgi:hypothetical protein
MIPSLRHRFDSVMVEIFDTADGVRVPYLQFAWRKLPAGRSGSPKLVSGERHCGMT